MTILFKYKIAIASIFFLMQIISSEISMKFLNNFNFPSSNKATSFILTNSSNDAIDISKYNYPKKSDFKSDEFILAILGTNDIHGQAYERDFIKSNNSYKVGGYKLLSGVIKSLKKDFEDQFLWFDAGDQFTGTVENINTTGQLMVDFYNAMKVDSVAIGNHEWDNKEDQLRKWMSKEMGRYLNSTLVKKKNLYLAANLNLKDGQVEDLPNKMPTKIFDFLNGKIKIGVIGLTTLESIEKTSYFPTGKFNISPYKLIVEQLSRELKSKGAHAVLILSHVGMTCKDANWKEDQINEYYRLDIRNRTTKQEMTCKGEMYDLLNQLEEGTVNGVIGGHVHESIHHFIKNTPVIQNPMSNIFTNVLYLKFKLDQNGNYFHVAESSAIEGPIPLCSKIYTNNMRCNTYQELTDNINLSEFTFHGGKFEPDPNVMKVFDSYKALDEDIQKMKKNIIFTTEVRMERSAVKENILGNLVADMHKVLTNSDVGMVATGNLRYIWEKGQVSEYEFKNMFPFGGNFARYNVTGKNLKKIIQTLQEGKSAYYSFSGVNMTLLRYNETYTRLDVESLILADGSKIDDTKLYSFSSGEFMLLGGDDMKNFKVNGTITINSTSIENSLPITETFLAYLKNIGVFKEDQAKKYLGKLIIKDVTQHISLLNLRFLDEEFHRDDYDKNFRFLSDDIEDGHF